MKVNKKQLNKFFKDMRVESAKEWRITTSRIVHKDKKKHNNKYMCRGRIL